MCIKSNIIINNLQDYHTCRERASSKFSNEINNELDHTNIETNDNEFFNTKELYYDIALNCLNEDMLLICLLNNLLFCLEQINLKIDDFFVD